MKYTLEILEDAVNNCISFAGVLRYLGIRQTGGSQSHIKRKVIEYKIDYSHFLGSASNKGRSFPQQRLTKEEILVKRESGRRQHSHLLRRALLEAGVLYECLECSNNGLWQGKKLALEVDHKNGDWLDDSKENLRFLCPNCHSQTSNFGSKRKGA